MGKEQDIRLAYKRLFLTETGAVRPEAQIILDDLYHFAFFFRAYTRPEVMHEPMTLAHIEGNRETVKHILSRCGVTKNETARKTLDILKGD